MNDLKLQEFTASLTDFASQMNQIETDVENNNLAVLSVDDRKQIYNESLGHFKKVKELLK